MAKRKFSCNTAFSCCKFISKTGVWFYSISTLQMFKIKNLLIPIGVTNINIVSKSISNNFYKLSNDIYFAMIMKIFFSEF